MTAEKADGAGMADDAGMAGTAGKGGTAGNAGKADDDEAIAAAHPFPESLCHHCAHRRLIATKTSQFIMCTALATKYPPQPVLLCAAVALRS